MSAIIPPYRGAQALWDAVKAEALETTPDLQPGWWFEPPGFKKGATWCSKAAQRILKRLGVPFPSEKLANEQALWLDSAEARSKGWYQCTEPRAIERAAVGFPVVAVWFNPAAPPNNHGHIGIGVPGPVGATELHVAAAGASNHSDIRRSGTFGPNVPMFHTHD